MQRIPRTHDISFFLDLNERGQLDLNPPYQRRSVWTRGDREYFIDTIFHNYPSPAIFIHKETNESGKSIHHVVDGKQRLETIIDFTQGKIRIPRNFGDERFNGKKWADLTPDDKRLFWDYPISVEFLPVIDEAVVNSVFERINRNSRKLTAQELRHAKFEGWFASFVEAQAADEDWEKFGVVTKARAKRMGDVQFIAELLMVVIKGDIIGFDQNVIDQIYADYEDPDDVLALQTTDEIAEGFSRAKEALRAMLRVNPSLKQHLKTLANIYTLWSYLVLESEEIDPEALANHYHQFMVEVAKHQANPMLPISDTDPVDIAANTYAVHLTGASTDLSPRRSRLESLKAGLAQMQ